MSLHPIEAILDELSNQKMVCAVFKNLHRVEAAMLGQADLDLLTYNCSRHDICKTFESHKWFPALNTDVPSSAIMHFFYIDPLNNKRLYHVHMYEKLHT